jgi:Uma2 family endonuclease
MTDSGSITLRLRPGLRLSDAAFRKLYRANPDLWLERSAEGELIVMPPAGPDSSRRDVGLTTQLSIWNSATQLGGVFDGTVGFTLPNTAIRGPDASWIAKERWDHVSERDRRKFTAIVPDFVVELQSWSDELPPLRKKMLEYIDQVARLGWLIDPKQTMVEIYRPDRPVEILERPATLSGEDVLPGFVLNLNGILDREG